jgi:hypothetical protein
LPLQENKDTKILPDS